MRFLPDCTSKWHSYSTLRIFKYVEIHRFRDHSTDRISSSNNNKYDDGEWKHARAAYSCTARETKPAVPDIVNSGLRTKTFLFYGYAYEQLRRKILYF
jgi:hypothetical protein